MNRATLKTLERRIVKMNKLVIGLLLLLSGCSATERDDKCEVTCEECKKIIVVCQQDETKIDVKG